jgi:hypothetical protein
MDFIDQPTTNTKINELINLKHLMHDEPVKYCLYVHIDSDSEIVQSLVIDIILSYKTFKPVKKNFMYTCNDTPQEEMQKHVKEIEQEIYQYTKCFVDIVLFKPLKFW